MKIAVTGHRPKRLNGQEKEVAEWLRERLKEYGTGSTLICGMAQGVDQIAALVAIEEDIPLSCYFAYRRDLHPAEEYFVDNAAEVRYVSEEFYHGVHIDRDRRMVNDCDLLLVVWDGIKKGGTYQTYEYAKKKGKKIVMYDWRKL